jgi:hypothetical protein
VRLYGYVVDPLAEADPWGLSGCPKRTPPRLEEGNEREGWIHIQARHITGSDPGGDLFATGTTRADIEKAVFRVVMKGTRTSPPNRVIQVFEKRMKVAGRRDRVCVVVDSADGNRVITAFPRLSS